MKQADIQLQVKKFIKAKPDKVFEAWTNPELMKKWFAPGEMKVPNASSDLKVDGAYHVEMKGVMNGENINPTVGGKYTKTIPNELLQFTWSWQGDPSPETIVTVELKEMNGGTEVTLTHERFTSIESKSKHEHGWMGCLENLSRYLNGI